MASGIITGKTNIPTKLAKYEGLTTDTASIVVNNDDKTIRADVNVEEVTKDCATKEELQHLDDIKADKVGPLPCYEVSRGNNVSTFISNHDIDKKEIMLNCSGTALIGKFSKKSGAYWGFNFGEIATGNIYHSSPIILGNLTFEDIFSSEYNIPLEKTNNKITELTSESTDTEYPSAKCVYDAIEDITPVEVPDDEADFSKYVGKAFIYGGVNYYPINERDWINFRDDLYMYFASIDSHNSLYEYAELPLFNIVSNPMQIIYLRYNSRLSEDDIYLLKNCKALLALQDDAGDWKYFVPLRYAPEDSPNTVWLSNTESYGKTIECTSVKAETGYTGQDVWDSYEQVEIKEVIANPTGVITKVLSSIQIGNTKYSVGTNLYQHSIRVVDQQNDAYSFFIISNSDNPITAMNNWNFTVGENCISISKEIDLDAWLSLPSSIDYDANQHAVNANISSDLSVTISDVVSIDDTVIGL